MPQQPHITPLTIGHLRADLSAWYGLPAGHPYAGRIDEIPIQCFHIALPGRSVLVDAPAPEFPADAAEMAIPGYTALPLREQLAAAGIEPAGISDVVITHVHFDHFNGLTYQADGRYQPCFPNARHYVGAADWQPKTFDDLARRTLGVVHEHGLLQLTAGVYDLGDGLTLLPAPGESPGHQVLLVEAGGGEACFCGDLFHHELEFAELERNVTWAERAAMAASKEMVLARAAARGTALYFAHIDGLYGVERGSAGFVIG